MANLDELQQRLAAALERIENRSAAKLQVDAEVSQLRADLALAEAKVTELTAQLDGEHAKAARDAKEIDALQESVKNLEQGLCQLRAANEVLTEANTRLMEAVDADTIAQAVKAELAALKAARDAQEDHMRVLLAAAAPLLKDTPYA